MDVARLNFSHGSYEEHKQKCEFVRKVSEEIGLSIAILQDLQELKIRIQTFKNGEVELLNGADFMLTVRNVSGVEDISGEDVRCKVIYGGIISDHKGLNLPNSILSVEPLTP